MGKLNNAITPDITKVLILIPEIKKTINPELNTTNAVPKSGWLNIKNTGTINKIDGNNILCLIS
mgnify:CR=1 FL=1